MNNFPFLSDLNSEQKKAVQTTKGKLLVLAGAGSGKTKVITYRIAYLISACSVDPSSILGLTFTNKAAQEMRERLSRLLDPKIAKKVTLSTFHSFCMKILRSDIHHLGYTREFSLYDEKDLQRLATQTAREILGSEQELTGLSSVLESISFAKNKGCFDLEEAPKIPPSFTKDLYERLESALKIFNAVDFDSLLSLSVQLFQKHPAVLEQYQKKFQYLLIDEYQDTNPIQYQLAKLLSARHQNLCVVGDDDQSIYGWRGSDVSHILQFPADTLIKLEQNYRSTPEILAAANAVIGHNQTRHQKALWSAKKSGEKISLFHAPTDLDEAKGVVDRIRMLKKEKGLEWHEMAILYRSNALSRNFEVALMQALWEEDGSFCRGIPYEIFGGIKFSERSEIKDLLAYLRVIANPKDEEALLRIINVPRRGISDQTLSVLTEKNRKEKIPLFELLKQVSLLPPEKIKEEFSFQSRTLKGLVSFVETIEEAKLRFAKKPLFPSLNWLIEKIDYKKAIEEEAKGEKLRQMKRENVQECVNALAQYEEEEENPSLQDFIATTLLLQNNFQDTFQTRDQVQLMTLHSAKGLEFRACFIVGLEDHLLPHEKSIESQSVEEERRLFYVGITRAMEYLTLSMARSRMKMGKYRATSPSRFLTEIPKDLLKVSFWNQVC